MRLAEARQNMILNTGRVQKDNMHIFYNLHVPCNRMSRSNTKSGKTIAVFSMSGGKRKSFFISECQGIKKIGLFCSIIGEHWRYETKRSSRTRRYGW